MRIFDSFPGADGTSDKAFWWGLKNSGLVGPQCGELNSGIVVLVPGILFAQTDCKLEEMYSRFLGVV